MIDGSRPGPERVDPVGQTPAEVVRLAVRCERLEAALAWMYERDQDLCAEIERLAPGPTNLEVACGILNENYLLAGEIARALDAALVAAGATEKAGT